MAMRGGDASNRMDDIISKLDSLRKDATKVVTFRLEHQVYQELKNEADRKGLRVAQLVKSYVVQGLRNE